MSINIKMTQYDLCVSVHCHNEDDSFEVNTLGFLSLLDDFLRKLELYDNVDIEIKKKAIEEETDAVTVTEYESGASVWPFPNTVSVNTGPGTQQDLIFDNMNRG